MDALTRIGWIGFITLVLAVGGCGGGGGGGDGVGTQPAGTVVGAAGGTVSGPNGAKVVIPAGALATNTTINIEQTSAGAPPLPTGVSSFGLMFAFTPHGTRFAAPVTVTVPFDPASVSSSVTPTLYKTNAQNQWEQVANVTVNADTLSAQVTSFSNFTAAIERLALIRTWEFVENGAAPITPGTPPVPGLLHEILFFPGDPVFDLNGDDKRTLEVFSSAGGFDFSVSSEDRGSAKLTQTHHFIKRASNATLQLIITEGRVEALDFNGNPTGSECDRSIVVANFTVTCTLLGATIGFEAAVRTLSGVLLLGKNGQPLLDINDSAILMGRTGLWDFKFESNNSMSAWTKADFEQTKDVSDNPAQFHPRMRLIKPLFIDLDLSSVEVDAKFAVTIKIQAFTFNKRGRESGIGAFLRDPAKTGGTVMNFTGLEPTDEPFAPPALDRAPAPCTTGPDPAAGVLQFSAATYAVFEAPVAGFSIPVIFVTRTQGSTGSVSATLTASGGTATPGVHYTPLSTSIHFADGDTAPRTVPFDILANSNNEPDSTVNLTLSAPGGCATLGALSSAVLTILDDDRPPTLPPSFTIGGTVTGLAGTGLVLQHVTTGENLATGNGPFTFSQQLLSGFAYSVAVGTQPSNPSQLCTITNGSGVANANITNVAVNCVTPAANGALDPTFADAGKVSTAFGGDNTAMALQADGKIVMVGGSSTDFLLARYNANGNLDAGFGSAGTVTTDIAAGQDEAHGVAIQSDGKIVVAGQAVVGRTANNLFNFDFAVARYNADGSLDTSFGAGGKVTTDFNGQTDRAFAVAIQGDGKIVVVGSAGFSSPTGGGTDFAVARYNPNGTLDTSFGSGGKVTSDIGGATDIARNVVLQGNGAILVSGQLTLGSSASLDHAGLARYDANGNPDGSFGNGGKLTLANLALGEALALQADGPILVAGSAPVGASSLFALMRLDANGSADSGFGAAGLVTAAFSTQDDFGRAVAVQADGRIVVAGQSSNRSNADFAVARFSANGAPDASFGSAGKLTIDFFGSFDGAENVVVQPDGKIVLGGFARNGTRTGYGLARVLP